MLGLSIPDCSHITNLHARGNVRTYPADRYCEISHYPNMARRGVPKQVNWYLREWMDTVFPVARGRQTRMMELTGWSKATTSQLYNGDQDYSPKVVNEAALALKVEPFELLIPPERAMAIRSYRDSAAQLVNAEPEPLPPTSLNMYAAERKTQPAKPGRKTA